MLDGDWSSDVCSSDLIDNFSQFEEHVDEGVRQAAPKAA
jgi:hypothetical protein